MCIAILNVKNAPRLTRDQWEACYDSNRDGIGMVWIENGLFRVKKELKDWKKMYDRYREIPEDRSNIMIHFRFATHGTVNYDNCHPFRVNDDLMFCHNGIIRVPATKTKSDTRVFNEMVLSTLKTHEIMSPVGIQSISEVIDGSKLIFLRRDDTFAIANERLGHWDEGNWFSNRGYVPYDYNASKYRVYKGDYDECYSCLGVSRQIVEIDGYALCLSCAKEYLNQLDDEYDANESSTTKTASCSPRLLF